jgi:hypothetical protein
MFGVVLSLLQHLMTVHSARNSMFVDWPVIGTEGGMVSVSLVQHEAAMTLGATDSHPKLARLMLCLRLDLLHNLLQVLLDHLQMLQQSSSCQEAELQQQLQQRHEAAAQVCVQATAVLRNLAVHPGHAPLFVQQQGLPLNALLQLLPAFGAAGEVALNVSRCLSKLSLQEACREAMLQLQLPHHCSLLQHDGCSKDSHSGALLVATATAVPCLLQVLLKADAAESSQRPLVLRVAFVLGNFTTFNPEARTAVADTPNALDGLLQLSLAVLHAAQEQQEQQQAVITQQQSGSTGAGGLVAAEELLVKLLRLIGNTAIDETAGTALACSEAAVQLMIGVLQEYEFEQQEELVLNAVAALTNLVFYQEPNTVSRRLAACGLVHECSE